MTDEITKYTSLEFMVLICIWLGEHLCEAPWGSRGEDGGFVVKAKKQVHATH